MVGNRTALQSQKAVNTYLKNKKKLLPFSFALEYI